MLINFIDQNEDKKVRTLVIHKMSYLDFLRIREDASNFFDGVMRNPVTSYNSEV